MAAIGDETIQALGEVAGRQHGIVSTNQVAALCGTTGLARLLSYRVLTAVWQGCYSTVAGPLGPAALLTAAALSLDRPVVGCLHTAAALYGFDTVPDQRVHILGPTSSTSIRAGLIVHRAPTHAPLGSMDGLSLTDPTETAIRVAARSDRLSTTGGTTLVRQAARWERAPRALAALDAAVRTGSTSVDKLADLAERMSINGIVRVRQLIPLARPEAESPGESWLRWVFIDSGLPVPEPQIQVRCRPGAHYRLDLGWPAVKVACEYDGQQFHTGEALHKDRERGLALSAEGWQMINVTASMVWNARDLLVAWVRTALRARGLT